MFFRRRAAAPVQEAQPDTLPAVPLALPDSVELDEVARLRQALQRAAADQTDVEAALHDCRRALADCERLLEAERHQREALADRHMRLSTELSDTLSGMSGRLGEGKEIIDRSLAALDQVNQRAAASKEAVEALSESYRQVQAVINSIKAIAGQTQMLALNAAIEAARAGDHGRGFAIVAKEVKTLADDTAAATANISQMVSQWQQQTASAVATIGDSLTETDAGAELAFDIGMVLNDLEQRLADCQAACAQP